MTGTPESMHKSIKPIKNITTVRLFIWISCALFLFFLVWAALARLDIVSMASGQVIPSTKVKSVQHYEGGIILDIKVKEGEEVKAGQPLVELEETIQGASVEELAVRLTSLKVEAIRLTALTKGEKTLIYPKELAEREPALIQESIALFNSIKKRMATAEEIQRQNIIQRKQDIAEINARLRNNRNNLNILQKQIKLSAELLREQLTTEFKHLEYKRQESSLRNKIEQDRAALPRAEAALNEAKQELENTITKNNEETRGKLIKINQELEELSQRMKKFADTLSRTTIRSPVDGVVKKLYYVTKGGVVRAGETIVDIVPSSDKLVVEASLPIADIGYVQVGQKATVKLASSDGARFSKLDGIVTQISPDTFTTQTGETYYSVRIEVDSNAFTHGSFSYKLIPGMLVVAYIHTGTRSVLEYLFDPFIGSLGEALQER